MSATIVLNQSNIVTSDNATLVYKFPNSVQFPHHQIAIQSVTMYYSWQNINSATLLNNTFSYTWTALGVTTTYQVVIPPGLYEISDINAYMQFVMINNGHYLIDSNGQNVYYAEFLVNTSLYAVQINTYAVPVSTGNFTFAANTWTGVAGTAYANWTSPSNFNIGPATQPVPGLASAGLPTVTCNPVITLPANFNLIVGFAAGFATTANTGVGTTLSFTSTVSPQVQPNPALYFSITNINNKFASPSSIIYALSPSVAFGAQITSVPPQFTWCNLMPGTYNEIRLQIFGTNKAPLTILDPNMTILLAIRDTHDLGITDVVNALQGNK